MRSTRVRATALVMLSASVFLGCAKVEAPTILDARAKPPVIYAVNYPLTWMAERIGGDAADVRFAAPPDVDPAYWQPDRDTVAALQQADGILLNGADYAKWVKTSTLPEKALVNTSAAFSDQYLTVADATMHSHGPEGMHAHEGTDFNTWLDPVLAAKQAEAVCEALCTWVPEQAEIFRDRLSRVKNDLAELDEALQAYASLIGSAPLIASHPVYGYLAKRYRWNLVSLHWEPGEMPSAEEMESVREAAPDPSGDHHDLGRYSRRAHRDASRCLGNQDRRIRPLREPSRRGGLSVRDARECQTTAESARRCLIVVGSSRRPPWARHPLTPKLPPRP